MRHALLILCDLLLLTAATQAAIKTQEIDYKVGDANFRGYLAYDDQAGKRPGVLVAPEWWGLTDYARHRAEMLAGLGYVAFAMDPFGEGKTTDDPQEAGKLAGALKGDVPELRRRANAALDILAKQPMVQPDKLAAIGYCFGGTTVLELARSGAPILGVVSFHGGLATPNPKDAANIKGKVLICHGGDDKFESAEEIAEFQQSMRDANIDWQMIIYGGAVHAFTNPDADRHHIPGIAYNANADHRSWQAMQSFLDEIFKEPPAASSRK